jgi:HEAT repeat protein
VKGFPFAAALLAISLVAHPAPAYVDWAPTLGKLIKDSKDIVVVRVEKVSEEKRAIIFKKVADLKGKHAGEEIKHQITDGLHPREPHTIMDWAEPGQLAILFHSGPDAVICIGRYWYQARALEAPWWSMTSGRPELALSYFGSADKLRNHVADMLAGKEVVITSLRFTDHSRATREAAIIRSELRGRAECPIERTKASLKMPSFAYLISGSTNPVAKEYQLGPAGNPDDVPDSIKRLQDQDITVRVEAARDLADMGVQAKAAVPALMEALNDKASSIRKAAAGALGNIGAEAAVPALTKALRDTDGKVRWQAADALGRIGPKAHRAVPALMEALKDKEPSMRGIAADALGGIGESYAAAAVPSLQQAVLKDTDHSVRLTAGIALVRINPLAAKAAMPLFFEELRKTQDTRIRLNYLTYLHRASLCGYWGEKEWIPTLIEIMRTDEFWVDRISAVGFLEGMTRTDAALADGALPGILESLKIDPDPNNRFDVASRLGDPAILKHAGRHKAALVQSLTDALKDKEPGVRIKAARSLGAIGADAKPAVKELTTLLKDAHPEARSSAAEALKLIQRE